MNDEHDNRQTDDEYMNKQRKPDLATASQIKYFNDLVAGRDWEVKVSELPQAWQMLFRRAAEAPEDTQLAKQDISKFIGLLKGCERKSQTIRATPMAASPELEDGMYRRKREHDDTIYKVYHTVHGANQQVAKRLVIEGPALKDGHVTATFKYEGKYPLKYLSPGDRMSMDDAAEFGKIYGICCICGRTLTNELSIALGIGPVCGNREFGNDFKIVNKMAEAKMNGYTPDEDELADAYYKAGIVGLTDEEMRARLAQIDNEIKELS